jgi:hypothetical protein
MALDEMINYLKWIVIFIVLFAGVYFMLKKIGVA